jgi:hypothetical protein
MNLIELQRALKQLRLSGIAAVLETRLHQAQAERMAPIDLISCLVSDELQRRGDRLLERRRKSAEFRDPQKTLDNFDFNFNKKMNRSLVFDLVLSKNSILPDQLVPRTFTAHVLGCKNARLFGSLLFPDRLYRWLDEPASTARH